MTAYPALLMVARGNHSSGYQGVLILLRSAPIPGQPFANETELATCGHAHRMTRTARDCAQRLGAQWRRNRAAWDAAKHDD